MKCVEGQVVKQVLALGCLNLPLGHVRQLVAAPALQVAQVPSQAEQTFPVELAQNPAEQVVPQELLEARYFPFAQDTQVVAVVPLHVRQEEWHCTQRFYVVSLSYPVGQVVRQVLALGCLNLPLGHVEHVVEVPAVHVAHVESQVEHICPEVFP